MQACLSEEAKEVYNSLVETNNQLESGSSTDANPLRMLRSGLPMVRPRVRGNKHATLGSGTTNPSMTLHPEDTFDVFNQRGSRTLPKSRPSGPPQFHTSFVNTNHNNSGKLTERRNSSPNSENNQNQNNVEDNPIPLPPRDRSKSLQPVTSLPRHQRKHPLIIPGGGVTRTLAKMTAGTSASEDQVDGHSKIPNFSDLEQGRAAARSAFTADLLGSPVIMRNRWDLVSKLLFSWD